MLQRNRYYRRPYMASLVEERKPRWTARIIVGGVALVVLWFVARGVVSLFQSSLERNAPAILTIEPQSNSVQVALQGGEWQQAENKLKIYPEDSVVTHAADTAVVQFFDDSRARLDNGTEVRIDGSERSTGNAASTVGFTIKSGRAWISVPDVNSFSGAITRIISTPNFTATVPSDTQALVSTSMVVVLKAQGEGVKLNLDSDGQKKEVVIGEGQYFSLTDEAKRQIAAGKDAYEFRDPITNQILRDDFLVRSYAMLSSGSETPDASTPDSAVGQAGDLTVTAPENNATVSGKAVTVTGKVSSRIVTLMVNGHEVTIGTDLSFSAQVALGSESTTLIRVEAQDKQGITLAQENRTVKVESRPFAPPVKVTAPVGSGQTLTTSEGEIEITGEAPAKATGIVINDYRLQLFKPGSKTWSYVAAARLSNLLVGKNTFTVYAVDADGNKTLPVSIFIEYKPGEATTSSASSTTSSTPIGQNSPMEPNTLVVDKPEAGTSAEVVDKEVVIEGRTSANTASVSVNGYTLSLYQAGKTTWNYIASTELETMKRGKNVYRIVSRNAKGEILDVLEYTIMLRLH